MTTSPQILSFIKSHEGLRLSAYRDPVGIWTIGYGHTGTAKQGQTITRAQADALFIKDVQEAEKAVKSLVRVPLNPNQFGALVSFVFNAGAFKFRGSTLLKKLNAGDYKGAADEFLRWDKAGCNTGQGCQRLPGLTKRRAEERNFFLGGSGAGSIIGFLIFAAVAFVVIKNI